MSLKDNRFGMHTNHNSQNPPPDPVFEWLPRAGWLPWLATTDEVERRGAAAAEPSPEAVVRVHDKAFAQRTAESEGHVSRVLRGAIWVLEPGDLSSPSEALARIETAQGSPSVQRARRLFGGLQGPNPDRHPRAKPWCGSAAPESTSSMFICGPACSGIP